MAAKCTVIKTVWKMKQYLLMKKSIIFTQLYKEILYFKQDFILKKITYWYFTSKIHYSIPYNR